MLCFYEYNKTIVYNGIESDLTSRQAAEICMVSMDELQKLHPITQALHKFDIYEVPKRNPYFKRKPHKGDLK